MPANKKAEPEKSKFRLLPKVINGGIAGVIGVSIVFPIDLVKTRMQNQAKNAKGGKQYKNVIDCFKQTYAKEGYFGMYRGSAVNILLVTPEKSIKLTANDTFRFYLTLPDGYVLGGIITPTSLVVITCCRTLPVFRQMIAGGMAGTCQIIVTTPMELLKIQMQDAGRISDSTRGGKPREKLTAWKLTKTLYAESGIRGLYKGFWITMCRDVTFSVIYFPTFAILAELGANKKVPGSSPPFWWSFISGCLGGSIGALLSTPFDVIKTRLQTIAKGRGDQICTSIADCAVKTFRNEGLSAFFKGGGVRMMTSAPLFGIAQTVYYLGIAEFLFGL